MTRKLSLSFLTCSAGPEESVRIAAAAGYDYLGFRLLPAFPGGVAFPLMDAPSRVSDLKQLMSDSGIGVFDIELIRISPDFDTEPLLPMLECAGGLGAKAVLVAVDDPDEARLTASFVRLCEAARPFGLSMNLEFMPQSDLRDLAAALRVLKAADQPNQGVIVDTLHVSRAQTSVAEIAAIPPQWLFYAQICDGPAEIPATREALNYAARHERFLPGDGAIDLTGMISALPIGLPVAVEIPNDRQQAGLSAAEWAARTFKASRRFLDQIDKKATE